VTDSVIAQGLKRQLECPEIHKKVEKLTGSKIGFNESVYNMVTDLKEHVPELSTRQLSVLVGVSRTVVMKALDNTVEREEWSEEDNPASCAAELTALREHHPGRQYEDDPEAAAESTVPVLYTAPSLRDPYRVADQSHTVKRPITLATSPFNVAA